MEADENSWPRWSNISVHSEVPWEFSVCEKSKLTSPGPDFLRTELLWREQGKVPHPVVLASLSNASKMPTLGLKWGFVLHGWAENKDFLQCQVWDSLRGSTGTAWAKAQTAESLWHHGAAPLNCLKVKLSSRPLSFSHS